MILVQKSDSVEHRHTQVEQYHVWITMSGDRLESLFAVIGAAHLVAICF